MDYRIQIAQVNETEVYIELLDMKTGLIITSGSALADKKAIRIAVDVMLDIYLEAK